MPHRVMLLLLLCLGTGTATAEIVVGFAQDNLANDWRLAQVKGVEAALARHPGVRFVYTDAGGSTARLIRDMEDLLAGGVDVLMVSPPDGAALTPAVSRAYQSGVPVILLTRRIETDDYSTFIAPDDAAIARQAGHFMAEAMGGRGRILMLQGVPGASTAIDRTDTFLAAIEPFPALSVVAVKPANYLRSDAVRAVEEVLESGVPFDAIYAQSDSMASGARLALSRAGVPLDSILMVGIDYISEAREAIRAGTQAASFTYPVCAEAAAEAALALARGEPVPRTIRVESVMVTRDNVEYVEPIF